MPTAPSTVFSGTWWQLVQSVPRSAFQGVDNVEPGMQFEANGPMGPITVVVKSVDADTVTIDAPAMPPATTGSELQIDLGSGNDSLIIDKDVTNPVFAFDDTGDDSRNNLWLALLTFGEGWHNNHHFFPGTARQGFRWWEVDITWYGLRLMQSLRLVHGLKPVPAWVLAKAKD